MQVAGANASLGLFFVGLPEAPVIGVVLRDVSLNGHHGLTIGDADAITRGSGSKVEIFLDFRERIITG